MTCSEAQTTIDRTLRALAQAAVVDAERAVAKAKREVDVLIERAAENEDFSMAWRRLDAAERAANVARVQLVEIDHDRTMRRYRADAAQR